MVARQETQRGNGEIQTTKREEKKRKAKMNCIHNAMHKTTQTATADIDAHKDPSPSERNGSPSGVILDTT
jgi:hypothetical protein